MGTPAAAAGQGFRARRPVSPDRHSYIGYAPSRIYGTPPPMLWVYRLGLEHAKQFLLTGCAIDAETAYRIGAEELREPGRLIH